MRIAWATSPSTTKARLAGVTTSGAYGHSVKKSLAFAYVDPELAASGAPLEILMLGERRKARILDEAAWDPLNNA